MDYVFVFNAIEALLWTLMAVALVVIAAIQKGVRGRLILAALTFLMFAGSDIIEMQTGAWWRPWWLLVWKAMCIAGFVALAVYHYRSGRASTNTYDSQK